LVVTTWPLSSICLFLIPSHTIEAFSCVGSCPLWVWRLA
jgi:hypothetical protein